MGGWGGERSTCNRFREAVRKVGRTAVKCGVLEAQKSFKEDVMIGCQMLIDQVIHRLKNNYSNVVVICDLGK